MAKQCSTCPFKQGSKYEALSPALAESALTDASRICHCTGSNAIHESTGKPERICRGARDLQLQLFHGLGFIDSPTDEAWAAKCEELGLGSS